MEIDGFKITNEIDYDVEPLMVTREDPVTLPDYEDKCGSCCLCKSTFEDIQHAVKHIHRCHGILGGSQNIMVDADRLLKGGYLAIPIDEINNHLTEAGEELEAAWRKKQEKLKGKESIVEEEFLQGVKEDL